MWSISNLESPTGRLETSGNRPFRSRSGFELQGSCGTRGTHTCMSHTAPWFTASRETSGIVAVGRAGACWGGRWKGNDEDSRGGSTGGPVWITTITNRWSGSNSQHNYRFSSSLGSMTFTEGSLQQTDHASSYSVHKYDPPTLPLFLK